MSTKGIKNLEQKMENLSFQDFRYKALESAKDFKTSWIGLGQVLFSVWKEKLYLEWGYEEFEKYLDKEIGIKKQTAVKLLRSYSFLKKEAPVHLDKEHNKGVEASFVPSFEAVEVLRSARENKGLEGTDYERIKKHVLEEGKDPGFVKKELACVLKEHEQIDPEEAENRRNILLLRRLLNSLKAVEAEIKDCELLTRDVLRKCADIATQIEIRLDLTKRS